MKAIIMAGGKGTRISDPSYPIPKVLREAAGKPLLQYVLNTIDDYHKEDITIIVGFYERTGHESVSGLSDTPCRSSS